MPVICHLISNLISSLLDQRFNVLYICLFFFSLTGNGLGIRVVGGKEVPGSNGEIGAYVAKVLPGGAAEQTGKILEGNFYHELSKKTKKLLESTIHEKSALAQPIGNFI